MSSFPLGTPVLDLVTVTQDPTATQNKDTSLVTATSGRHGETLVSEIHGARYVKASRGNLFWGTSGVAGASLLAPGGTTGSQKIGLRRTDSLLLASCSTDFMRASISEILPSDFSICSSDL